MGEAPEFREYVRSRQQSLVRAAYLVTGDLQHAEELVQAALERVWVRWQRISQVDDVDAYVYRVMFRLHLNLRRRRWWGELPTENSPDRAATNSPEDGLIERMAVMAALAQLPPRQRAVMVLRFYLDFSEAQTANALGCRLGTVKSQSAKALASLRQIMRAPHPKEVP